MEKIEFRGKRIDTKEWVHGYYHYLSHSGTHCIDVPMADFNNSVLWHVDPATVGQYTGENAPNGKLFNGDIFEAGNGKVPTLIFWDDADNCWAVRNLKRNETHKLDKHFKRFIGNIVGNRWDNPELLGVQ